MNCELMLTYDTPALRQTGNMNLTGQKKYPNYIKYICLVFNSKRAYFQNISKMTSFWTADVAVIFMLLLTSYKTRMSGQVVVTTKDRLN